jgi:hypothetical protein
MSSVAGLAILRGLPRRSAASGARSPDDCDLPPSPQAASCLAGLRSVATVPVMRGMPLIAVMTLAGCTAVPPVDGAIQSSARFAYGDAVAADVQAIVNGMDVAEGRRRLVWLLRRAVPIEE